MPVSKEKAALYPRDWPAISLAVKEAAGWRCQECGAPHGEVIVRGEGGRVGTYMLANGDVHDEATGKLLGRAPGSEYEGRHVKVVLTVAHLDHDPTNCQAENLRAWCQLHHLRYDARHHATNAAATRRARRAAGDLFGVA